MVPLVEQRVAAIIGAMDDAMTTTLPPTSVVPTHEQTGTDDLAIPLPDVPLQPSTETLSPTATPQAAKATSPLVVEPELLNQLQQGQSINSTQCPASTCATVSAKTYR